MNLGERILYFSVSVIGVARRRLRQVANASRAFGDGPYGFSLKFKWIAPGAASVGRVRFCVENKRGPANAKARDWPIVREKSRRENCVMARSPGEDFGCMIRRTGSPALIYNVRVISRRFMARQQAVAESAGSKAQQAGVWDAFRRWGYLQANLDPLGDLQPVALPELDVQGADADAARKIYCGSVGVGVHAHRRSGEAALDQERMEREAAPRDRTGRRFSKRWCVRKFSSRFCRRDTWARSDIRSKARRRCCRCWTRY